VGLKVDSYIQWNTMMHETFFAEEPRARDWIQRDVSGLPILLVYGYQQSYRYRPCFNHQEYAVQDSYNETLSGKPTSL